MSQANSLDPKIMKATDDLQKLEVKLKQLAVLDYRAIALPLVKGLLQVRVPEFDGKNSISLQSTHWFFFACIRYTLCVMMTCLLSP